VCSSDLLAALGLVTIGSLLPATPLAHTLGFQPLPGLSFAALAGMVAAYLALIEIGKRVFYRASVATAATSRRYGTLHHLRRRAARFSTGARA
jgi:Mg2+-importing ATPase